MPAPHRRGVALGWGCTSQGFCGLHTFWKQANFVSRQFVELFLYVNIMPALYINGNLIWVTVLPFIGLSIITSEFWNVVYQRQQVQTMRSATPIVSSGSIPQPKVHLLALTLMMYDVSAYIHSWREMVFTTKRLSGRDQTSSSRIPRFNLRVHHVKVIKMSKLEI